MNTYTCPETFGTMTKCAHCGLDVHYLHVNSMDILNDNGEILTTIHGHELCLKGIEDEDLGKYVKEEE